MDLEASPRHIHEMFTVESILKHAHRVSVWSYRNPLRDYNLSVAGTSNLRPLLSSTSNCRYFYLCYKGRPAVTAETETKSQSLSDSIHCIHNGLSCPVQYYFNFTEPFTGQKSFTYSFAAICSQMSIHSTSVVRSTSFLDAHLEQLAAAQAYFEFKLFTYKAVALSARVHFE